MPNRKLVVIGDGPLFEQIKAEATRQRKRLRISALSGPLDYMQKRGVSYLLPKKISESLRSRPKPVARLLWLLARGAREIPLSMVLPDFISGIKHLKRSVTP